MEALREMGLNQVEAKVYVTLLELGSAVANKIAERCGIHRRSVYDALDMLIERGLVSFAIEAGRKYYTAEDPKRLLEILDEKKSLLLSVLPELKKKRDMSSYNQEINIYRGKKGIKNIFDDILKSGKEVRLFGSGGLFREMLGESYAEIWSARAISKGIRIKAIYSERARGSITRKPNQESRFIRGMMSPSSTTLYSDKIAIVMYSDQPIGIVVKSKEVCKAYQQYFNALWESART